MEQIKIGTCIPGKVAEKWLPAMKNYDFECFAVNFHMTYGEIDIRELAPKVQDILAGTGKTVTTLGYYCNALENESQRRDLEYAIDNAHLYGGDWEMTSHLHALKYLKFCRGGDFVPNPWDEK